MSKQVRSWSKPDGKPDLIGRKKVDWSIFEYGSHIPLEFHEDFEKANGGVHVDRGKSHDLELLIDNISYKAILSNLDKEGISVDTLQIRYDSNAQLKKLLRERFTSSYLYIKSEREKKSDDDKREQIIVPEDLSEQMAFYETDKPFQYRVEIISTKSLAEPFSKIFKDKEEANWAFDFLKDTIERLNVKDLNDERFALTFRHNQRVLRLNFGNWAVLQFYGPTYSEYKIGIALIEKQGLIKTEHKKWTPFKQTEESISVHELPVELVKPLEGELRNTYETTFAYIAKRFANWNKSNYRRFHQSTIVEAIFDQNKREKLFNEGIKVDSEPNFWWVCQGDSYTEDVGYKYIWAPLKTKDGKTLAHWENVKKTRKGDVIFNYADGYVQGVSIAKNDGYDFINEDPGKWEKEGMRADIEHFKIEPLSLEAIKSKKDVFKNVLENLKGPFDLNGDVKQGYLFEFNYEAAKLIRELYAKPFPEEIEQFFDADAAAIVQEPKFYRTIIDLLYAKKQVILYGPPGTGKTFSTKQIVIELMNDMP